jgi:hypothetical protein
MDSETTPAVSASSQPQPQQAATASVSVARVEEKDHRMNDEISSVPVAETTATTVLAATIQEPSVAAPAIAPEVEKDTQRIESETTPVAEEVESTVVASQRMVVEAAVAAADATTTPMTEKILHCTDNEKTEVAATVQPAEESPAPPAVGDDPAAASSDDAPVDEERNNGVDDKKTPTTEKAAPEPTVAEIPTDASSSDAAAATTAPVEENKHIMDYEETPAKEMAEPAPKPAPANIPTGASSVDAVAVPAAVAATTASVEENNNNMDYEETPMTEIAALAPKEAADASVDAGVAVSNSTTTVDGQGMWRSWTRVFAKPESACLDLLDNCFDAALKPNFHGKVSVESMSSFLFIRNNSQKPIKKLEDALTVYKSSKNSELSHNQHESSSATAHSNRFHQHHQHISSNSGSLRTEDDPSTRKDAIGENGVGLKHGCATLSDCSVIVTRNKDVVEIGFICRQLQSTSGVYLPSFSFTVSKTASSEISTQSLTGPISEWLSNHRSVQEALESAFRSDMKFKERNVEGVLTEWVHSLWADEWKAEDYIFLLALCNLKRSVQNKGIIFHSLIAFSKQSPAKNFLKQIRTMLPEYYVNLPSDGNFDFLIDKERIEFSYWQRRLVELTKFYVNVPVSTPFESLPDPVWIQGGEEKYPLAIYCGFDAQRINNDANQGIGTSPCRIYIYSCQAGRLIQMESDARFMLGLSTSGVDYCQGLTIIINDTEGKLPLTPTKDGIAWSERPHGNIHRQNLYAWAGAIAQLFWQHHRASFIAKGGNFSKATKEQMKSTIRSFATVQNRFDYSATKFGALEESSFTEWTNIPWKRVEPKYGTLHTIRKQQKSTFYISNPPGADTLFLLSQARAKTKKTKRKASSISTSKNDKVATGNVAADLGDGSALSQRPVDTADQPGTITQDENNPDDQNLDNDESAVSGRRRRRQRVDYHKLENQYSSMKFERRIQTKQTLTRLGRPVSKASMQALEDEMERENLKRIAAEADRDSCRIRIRELQRQVAAQQRRIQSLEGKQTTNGPPLPSTDTIADAGATSPTYTDMPESSSAAAPVSESNSNGTRTPSSNQSNSTDDVRIPLSGDRLETIDEKDSYLSVGDVVYAQWPQTLSKLYRYQWWWWWWCFAMLLNLFESMI